MRERAGEAEYGEEHHQVDESIYFSTSKRRLDLNVLLKRAKDQEKSDKKFNLLIYSCAACLLVMLLLIVSI